MIRSLYTSASGMLLGLRQQEVIASNISNASTIGYKADQSAQSAFAGVLARSIGPGSTPMPSRVERLIGRVGTGAFVQNVRTYLGQGAERETGSRLDVMVRGDGFFTIQTDEGVRYTRDGHFDRDEQDRLVTADGALVLDEDGQPIVLDSDMVRIKANGGVFRLVSTEQTHQDGSRTVQVEEVFVANLGLVLLDAGDLVRAGSSRFTLREGAEVTAAEFEGGNTFVLQGSLEEANVNIGQDASALYSIARTFQSSQRVFNAINQTLQTAVREIGRV